MLSKKKKILIISGAGLLVIAAVVLILIFACGNDEPEGLTEAEIKRLNTLKLATTYIEGGEFDRALDLIDGLLIINPDDEEALALQRAILAMDRSGNTGAGIFNQSLLEELLRQNQQLSSIIQRPVIVQTQPQNASSNIQNTTNNYTQNSSQDAAAEAAAERRAEAEAEEIRRKAQEEELARASREMQEVMRKVNNLVNDGKAKLAAGDFSGGVQLFNEAKNLIPPGENRFEAQTLSNMSDAFYDYSVNNSSSPNAREAVSNAAQYANEAVSKDANQALPHFVLGKIARDANQNDRAITHFREAARLDPNNYLNHHELGRVLFMSRRMSEARDSFQTAVRLNPNFEPSWYNLGGAFRALNRPDDALAAYRQAVAIKADYFAAHREIGRLLAAKNDTKGAVASFSAALQYNPNDFNTLCELAAAQNKAGNNIEAESLFARALAMNSSDAQTNYNMAVVKIELKKYNDAINNARIAVDANKTNALYVYTLGVALESSGAAELAVSAYKTAATLDSKYLRPRINLGSIYLATENFSDAVHYLNEAYAVEPANFEVNNNLGAVYAKMNNWTYSIVHYERALSAKQNDATVHFNLARAYAGAGELQKAQASYQAVLRLAPDNWDAMYELGMTCVSLGLNNEAKRYLQDLISRNPGYSQKIEAERILRSL